MDFKFTEEQEKFRKEVRDFMEDEIRQGLWKPACDGWVLVQCFLYIVSYGIMLV